MNKPSEAVVLMEVTFWERKNQTGEVSCLIGAEKELNRVRRERERESGVEGSLDRWSGKASKRGRLSWEASPGKSRRGARRGPRAPAARGLVRDQEGDFLH